MEEPVGRIWYPTIASFSRLILHDRRETGLSSRNVALPNLETRVSDILTVMDAVESERPVIMGLQESGAPGALLAATKPERVRSLIWFEPNPRFARAPDYPWGRTPEDMEAELRDIDLWGTLAYGQAFAHDEAARGNAGPRGLGRLHGEGEPERVHARCRAGALEDLVRDGRPGGPPRHPGVDVDPDLARPRGLHSNAVRGLADPRGRIKEMPGGDVLSYEEILAAADVVRLFAGVERTTVELDTILSTVLFTDIVGSTEKQASLGDHGWKGLVEQHHAVVRDALEHWRGVEHDTAGDGFYATFDGPARAIRCAQEVARRVRDLGIEIRAGVHTGECEVIDNKIGGITVSIGARVASKAGASEILISQTVKDLVAGSGLGFEDAGEHELKGIPDRWHLYRVADQES